MAFRLCIPANKWLMVIIIIIITIIIIIIIKSTKITLISQLRSSSGGASLFIHTRSCPGQQQSGIHSVYHTQYVHQDYLLNKASYITQVIPFTMLSFPQFDLFSQSDA